MELTDPADIYAYYLGTLVGNLHSLEVLLRIVLSGGKWTLNLDARPGDKVDLSAINEWASLSELVQRYNATVGRTHPQHLLTEGARIVKLRNALAHGMVVARSPQPPLRLIKFGKVKGSRDKATVEFAAEMTDDWLREERSLIREAIETVSAHVKATEA